MKRYEDESYADYCERRKFMNKSRKIKLQGTWEKRFPSVRERMAAESQRLKKLEAEKAERALAAEHREDCKVESK